MRVIFYFFKGYLFDTILFKGYLFDTILFKGYLFDTNRNAKSSTECFRVKKMALDGFPSKQDLVQTIRYIILIGVRRKHQLPACLPCGKSWPGRARAGGGQATAAHRGRVGEEVGVLRIPVVLASYVIAVLRCCGGGRSLSSHLLEPSNLKKTKFSCHNNGYDGNPNSIFHSNVCGWDRA